MQNLQLRTTNLVWLKFSFNNSYLCGTYDITELLHTLDCWYSVLVLEQNHQIKPLDHPTRIFTQQEPLIIKAMSKIHQQKKIDTFQVREKIQPVTRYSFREQDFSTIFSTQFATKKHQCLVPLQKSPWKTNSAEERWHTVIWFKLRTMKYGWLGYMVLHWNNEIWKADSKVEQYRRITYGHPVPLRNSNIYRSNYIVEQDIRGHLILQWNHNSHPPTPKNDLWSLKCNSGAAAESSTPQALCAATSDWKINHIDVKRKDLPTRDWATRS